MNIKGLYYSLRMECSSFRNEEKGKLVANNTRLYRDGESVCFKLWDTNVVTVYEDKVVVNTGGWDTKTTCERINRILGHLDLSIRREKGYLILYEHHSWRTWSTNESYFEITQPYHNADLIVSLDIDRKRSSPRIKAIYRKTLERIMYLR